MTLVHEPGSNHGGADGGADEVIVRAEPAATPTGPGGRFRRVDWKLGVASLAIALGVALVGFAISRSVTGDEVTKLPDQIESISPVPDAVQVPSQSNVVVDLVDGYTGEMTIDNVVYPTFRPEGTVDEGDDVLPAGGQVDVRDGVVFDPLNYKLTFTPGEDVGFEEWPVGNHHVRVVLWQEEDGELVPGSERSYNWTFNIV